MANTEGNHSAQNTRCGLANRSDGCKVCTKVKVQWPGKSSGKVFPSAVENESSKVDTTCSVETHQTQVQNEQNNDIKEIVPQDQENTKVNEQNELEFASNAKQETCDEAEGGRVSAARQRAQRRWRMGLLKRSKLGGIGEEVTGLFPDYFPSPLRAEESTEEDDILTSLKETKQKHRAKLLKQNSIDKIDRELADRETKLFAGSWLQIYS